MIFIGSDGGNEPVVHGKDDIVGMIPGDKHVKSLGSLHTFDWCYQE